MKILVVEDVYLMRKILDNVFHPIAQIDFANNGLDAYDFYLNQIKNNDPYNLICLDILLPQLDGIEVLKKIRAHENELQIPKTERAKVIMISTLSDKNIVMRCANAGCDGFIVKPINKKRIFEELEKLGLIAASD